MAERRPPDETDKLRPEVPDEREIAAATRTLVIGPYLSRAARAAAARTGLAATAENPRPPEARLDEAVGLARAINLDVLGSATVTVNAPRPATLLGRGKVEELAGLVRADGIGLVVMDAALTPVQQRNLEKAWGTKVIDRTGL
ncbi:MAG: GTPase HflX, partial [Methylobacteriaceae bacterium]|nr:GTPase HflX [Methylobacteriaceae bacterium]